MTDLQFMINIFNLAKQTLLLTNIFAHLVCETSLLVGYLVNKSFAAAAGISSS